MPIFRGSAYGIEALERLANSLPYISPRTLASHAAKDILNTVALTRFFASADRFKSAAEAVYWKALVATLAFGGLRLSELAGLRWADVDLGKRLLRIRGTQEKQLKTEASARAVHGCDELWPWLEQLKPITGGFDLVFPVFVRGKLKNRSWLSVLDGQPKAHELSKRLAKLEAVRLLGRKIPMRARRWCRTELLSRGVPVHVVDAQMGHSSDTGEAFYTKSEAVVSAFYGRGPGQTIHQTIHPALAAGG